jgi:hypothetical protein
MMLVPTSAFFACAWPVNFAWFFAGASFRALRLVVDLVVGAIGGRS